MTQSTVVELFQRLTDDPTLYHAAVIRLEGRKGRDAASALASLASERGLECGAEEVFRVYCGLKQRAIETGALSEGALSDEELETIAGGTLPVPIPYPTSGVGRISTSTLSLELASLQLFSW